MDFLPPFIFFIILDSSAIHILIYASSYTYVGVFLGQKQRSIITELGDEPILYFNVWCQIALQVAMPVCNPASR